jgi:hypothetical protein
MIKSEQEELRLLLRSRFPILVVETAEEPSTGPTAVACRPTRDSR